MQADRVAHDVVEDIMADCRDFAGDLVSERERKRLDAGTAGSVMRIGMTDAGGANAHEHVTGTAKWHRDFGIFNGVTRGGETDSAHQEA